MPKPDTSSKVNNSTLTPAVFDVQQQIHYKYLYRTHLFRVGFSEHPETYLVNISGTTLDDHKVEVSRVYDELHPLMAIGRAVTEFYDTMYAAVSAASLSNNELSNNQFSYGTRNNACRCDRTDRSGVQLGAVQAPAYADHPLSVE